MASGMHVGWYSCGEEGLLGVSLEGMWDILPLPLLPPQCTTTTSLLNFYVPICEFPLWLFFCDVLPHLGEVPNHSPPPLWFGLPGFSPAWPTTPYLFAAARSTLASPAFHMPSTRPPQGLCTCYTLLQNALPQVLAPMWLTLVHIQTSAHI